MPRHDHALFSTQAKGWVAAFGTVYFMPGVFNQVTRPGPVKYVVRLVWVGYLQFDWVSDVRSLLATWTAIMTMRRCVLAAYTLSDR